MITFTKCYACQLHFNFISIFCLFVVIISLLVPVGHVLVGLARDKRATGTQTPTPRSAADRPRAVISGVYTSVVCHVSSLPSRCLVWPCVAVMASSFLFWFSNIYSVKDQTIARIYNECMKIRKHVQNFCQFLPSLLRCFILSFLYCFILLVPCTYTLPLGNCFSMVVDIVYICCDFLIFHFLYICLWHILRAFCRCLCSSALLLFTNQTQISLTRDWPKSHEVTPR